MNNSFFTNKESKYIEKLFEEMQNNNNEIQFSDMKEVFANLGFEKQVISEQLEKIKKRTKENYNIGNELDIVIGNKHIRLIVI